MTLPREAVVGGLVGLTFLALAIVVGGSLGLPALRVYSVLFGLGGGGAVGVLAALATHLARGPAGYEPLQGDASAWGLAELDEAGGEPPR